MRVPLNRQTQGLRIIEGCQEYFDKQRIAVQAGVARIISNEKFWIQLANLSSEEVRLQPRGRIASALQMPIHTTDAEINMISTEEVERQRLLNPKELAQPFQEIWDNINEITFQGESEAVTELVQPDPEADPTLPAEPLFDSFDLIQLSKEEHGRVTHMCKPFKNLWSSKLGQINISMHKLDLEPASKPAYMLPYRTEPEKRRIIEEEIEKMMDMGVVERTRPGESEWAAPVVVVPKRGGKWSFCVDFVSLII